MSIHPYVLFFCWWIIPFPAYAQNPDSLLLAHRQEIDPAVHRIHDAEQLAHFFQSLTQLEGRQRRAVVVAHVGDSHVQADYLPGVLRTAFWDRFGCAGRGIVFPYALAETHGPLDYDWSSADPWTYRRRTFQSGGPDIGITGMGLRGSSHAVSLDFAFAKNQEIPFDHLTLFGDEQTQWRVQVIDAARPPALPAQWRYHTVRPGETLYGIGRRYGQSVRQLLSWNQLSSPLIHPNQQLRVEQQKGQVTATYTLQAADTITAGLRLLALPHPATRFRLWGESPGYPHLYGVVLHHRQQAGILYHMLGANGTTYYHFHRSGTFWRQMAALQPDLILLTLGTNEALQSRFPGQDIEQEVRGFLRKLKEIAPGGRILLITNPDAGHSDGRIREKPRRMRDLLLRVAREEQVAAYDLYAVMGGAGSIYSWREAQLAYRDLIHFTKKGYIFQGALVFDALMQAYQAHD